MPAPRQYPPELRDRAVELVLSSGQELKRLRRENIELHRTNEILKLASAFFAQELDPTRRRS